MNTIKSKSAGKAAFVAAALLAAILGMSVPSASASAGQATLMPGEVMHGGQSLIDGPYTMAMQTDGNLVLYANGNQALWQSHTYNNPGSDVVMQTDGNLVVYTPDGQALWQSGTYNQPGDHLVVQSDGNAVIYTPSGQARWATNTVQTPPSASSPPTVAIAQACAYENYALLGTVATACLRVRPFSALTTHPGGWLAQAGCWGSVHLPAGWDCINPPRGTDSHGSTWFQYGAWHYWVHYVVERWTAPLVTYQKDCLDVDIWMRDDGSWWGSTNVWQIPSQDLSC